jgi:predicted nucleotidyltransferase
MHPPVSPSGHHVKDVFIKILLYFDVFNYPLSEKEVTCFAGVPDEKIQEAQAFLTEMVKAGWISQHKGFFFVGSDKSVVDRRIKGNRRARKRMRTASRYSRIISWFPYVRGVYLSGSISKGFLSENDDIDYFIIAAPGRIWIARSMLTIFKKVFLFNSFKNFCINYFIDTENLCIREKNRFTATELLFLVPMYNLPLYNGFIRANAWARQYYPEFRQNDSHAFNANPLAKRFLEWSLDNGLGDRLDNYLMAISRSYIRKKYQSLDDESFDNCFLLDKRELRYLPNRHQFAILDKFAARLAAFEKQMGIRIAPDPERT